MKKYRMLHRKLKVRKPSDNLPGKADEKKHNAAYYAFCKKRNIGNGWKNINFKREEVL